MQPSMSTNRVLKIKMVSTHMCGVLQRPRAAMGDLCAPSPPPSHPEHSCLTGCAHTYRCRLAQGYDPSPDLSLSREARDDMIHPLTSPTCPGRPGRLPGRSRGSGCGEARPWSSRRRTQAGGSTRWVCMWLLTLALGTQFRKEANFLTWPDTAPSLLSSLH